jgi:hypothetical protein
MRVRRLKSRIHILDRAQRPYLNSRAVIIGVGSVATILIALTTQLAFPPSEDWRTAVYVFLGLLVTVVVADTADIIQRQIRDFLMERVNSRNERTAAVIGLCREAAHEFRAVTYFPVVGLRDEPDFAPAEYLRAIEGALDEEVDVTLVSISCEEAKRHCEEQGFGTRSVEALDWIAQRLEGLERRFADRFTVITVPPSAITVNICHNESSALMYHVGLDDDDGSGFKSTDARIVAVAKGGFARYQEFCRA